MYELVYRLEGGLKHLKQLLEEHISRVGLKAVQSCQESKESVVCTNKNIWYNMSKVLILDGS